eukprot:m.4481 g.4481  ORF g.4481 m.4481 type:complete len:170 (+) comp4501_c0_seq1:75-584(+)
MVQWFNLAGIVGVGRAITQPRLLVPSLRVTSIAEVKWQELKEQRNISRVVFDKDNCLTSPYALTLHPTVVESWHECLRVFGPDHVSIVSNSSGSLDDPDGKEADAIEHALGVRVLRHTVKKPGCVQEVLDHANEPDSSRICVVGDRVSPSDSFHTHTQWIHTCATQANS